MKNLSNVRSGNSWIEWSRVEIEWCFDIEWNVVEVERKLKNDGNWIFSWTLFWVMSNFLKWRRNGKSLADNITQNASEDILP